MERKTSFSSYLARSREWAEFIYRAIKTDTGEQPREFRSKGEETAVRLFFFLHALFFRILDKERKKAGAFLNDIISIHDLVEYHVEIIWEIQQTTRAASQKREGECASINTTVDVGEREMQSLVELERPSRPILQDVVGVDEEAATLCTHVFLDTIPVKSFSQNSNYHTHHCSFLFVLNASRSSSI